MDAPVRVNLFDVGSLEADAAVLAQRYRDATPFPHLVVDDLLLLDRDSLDRFPPTGWDGWRSLGDAYQRQKYVCDDIASIPEPFSTLVGQLSEPRFLRVLEEVTGIPGLLPDPYLTGGGLHLSGPGGLLAPHTDFHHYLKVGLYRRVNVLVYLNEAWDEGDGGCLEMWKDEQGAGRQVIVPTWGRSVIFTTTDTSIHGFPEPIAPGRWRRSLALYYYTAAEAATFSGDGTTYWRSHGRQQGVKQARLRLYQALLQASRALSILAQFANPNQGLREWLRARRERHAPR